MVKWLFVLYLYSMIIIYSMAAISTLFVISNTVRNLFWIRAAYFEVVCSRFLLSLKWQLK